MCVHTYMCMYARISIYTCVIIKDSYVHVGVKTTPHLYYILGLLHYSILPLDILERTCYTTLAVDAKRPSRSVKNKSQRRNHYGKEV